jgi:signal transduction histidine kinase
LSDFVVTDLKLSITQTPDEASEADVVIWDYEPGLHFSTIWPRNQRHLFVVDRDHINALFQELPSCPVNLLLKPVTRNTVRAFLTANVVPLSPSAPRSIFESLRTDRDNMLECLMDVNLKLQTFEQERTHFLARAVHDFRAPLSAIEGYCRLVLAGQLGPITENQKQAFERVEQSAKRLSRMTAGMFQLSIGERVETKLRLQKGDVRTCLDQALHEVTALVEQKRLRISTNLQAPTASLYFENEQISQVFMNLLENACKFTPKGGSIEIDGYSFMWERRRVRTSRPGNPVDRRTASCNLPNAFRVDVRDSGPGIRPEHLDKIFEDYVSFLTGDDRSGGGLGLAICKSIISAHQGHIWAHNSGGGAVFSFVLPFRSAASISPLDNSITLARASEAK